MVNSVIVLGGGSAGFMAAIALKAKSPALSVRVIRSRDIGIIGVGEGSTVTLTNFLHKYIGVGKKKFFQIAQPTWKLGLKFLWGPRPHFFYSFDTGPDHRPHGLPKGAGFYCDDAGAIDDIDRMSALMSRDRAFERSPTGGPLLHDAVAYHFENEKFVEFLDGYAVALGVQIVEETVAQVTQDERGITGLVLKSGATESADLYVDASGFVSMLLGKTLGEPFVSYGSSLFCDRAVVGGWDRTDEVIKPYTTCETMDAGWSWQIEHESRINRGYVYASAFISDEDAEREFRGKNPKVGPTRVVRFVTGRYERNWVKNVVAVGNASGFVEPLEATALGVIAMQSWILADSLVDCDRQIRPTQIATYNNYNARNWDSTRRFIAVHYRFNTRLDSEFWRACREKVDLAGAEPTVDVYRENGPSAFWGPTIFDPIDQFKTAGYSALLVGQCVPYRKTYLPTDKELQTWAAIRRKNADAAARALGVREALSAIRSPSWRWLT